ncbi:unnamed protein product, partial [marine sediment metagenome]
GVTAEGPLPGMAMWDQIVSYLKTRGLDKGPIGVELGHS